MAVVTPAQGSGRMLARRYHLLRVLGRGAMGAVWEAEDTFLRRPVAVKEVVLPPGLSPEERAVSCERTLREARAIARLGHQNVVTLFDVLDEDTRPWVVMELVPSRSLAEVIKADGPLHPLRVATVGLAVLGALEAAHSAGITHRDVKPGNILLGHDGRVKLTDFGIARAAGDTTITGTGLLIGSPSYLAPEIVRGQPARPACDLWGLGATLYAAVEGHAPFAGTDAMDTLSKVVQEPPAPFERSGPLVPALLGMLEKDPARRATAVEARRRLLEVLRAADTAEFPQSGPVSQPPAVAASVLAATVAGTGPLAPVVEPAEPGRAAQPDAPAPDLAGVAEPADASAAAAAPRVVPPTPRDGGPARDPSPFPLLDAPGPAGPGVVPEDARTEVVGTPPPPQVAPPGPPPGAPPVPPPGAPPGAPPGGAAGPLGLGGFSADRPPDRRRRDRTAVLVAVGLIVIMLVAAAVAGRALLGKPSSSGHRAGPVVPSATPTGPAALPAGFRRYQHPGGFSLAVPQGWTPSQVNPGIVDVQEPGSSRFLRLIRADSNASARTQLASAEPGFAHSHGDYRLIRLEKVTYRSYDTADWEFTFSKGGTLRHVLYRTIASGGASYGLYLSVPDSRWTDSRRIFDVAAATFALG